MMKKCFFKILFITTILWISCFFYSCGNNIEGEWYTIGFSSSDANSYEVKKSIDITGEHFVIDGKAYTYILDENYIVVSNDRTYTCLLYTSKIVQEEDVKVDVVNVGLKVTVKDLDTGEKETFAIVGATESDPINGKISTDSSLSLIHI